jgi:hypothetical protein
VRHSLPLLTQGSRCRRLVRPTGAEATTVEMEERVVIRARSFPAASLLESPYAKTLTKKIYGSIIAPRGIQSLDLVVLALKKPEEQYWCRGGGDKKGESGAEQVFVAKASNFKA